METQSAATSSVRAAALLFILLKRPCASKRRTARFDTDKSNAIREAEKAPTHRSLDAVHHGAAAVGAVVGHDLVPEGNPQLGLDLQDPKTDKQQSHKRRKDGDAS